VLKKAGRSADWHGVILPRRLTVSIAAFAALGVVTGSTALAAGGLEERSHRPKKPSRPGGAPPVAPIPLPPAQPSVVFVGPLDGQTVAKRTTFRVRLTNFTISPTLTPTRLVPGQGFLHFAMDGGALDVPGHSANGAQAVRAGTQGRYSPVQGTSLTYNNLPIGRHTLTVTLADNFHAEIGVSASLSFTVR
jgi:hypothetical protein